MGGIEALIARYGLAAVFAGVFVEGETALTIGGFAAHQGMLDPFAVWLVAALGAFMADQGWFHVARHNRQKPWLARFTASAAGRHALDRVNRGKQWFSFFVRFIFGLRTVGPVALGLSDVPALTFAGLNAAAAVIWAAVWTGAGFMFGRSVEAAFGHLAHAERRIGAALALAALTGTAVWIARRTVAARRSQGARR